MLVSKGAACSAINCSNNKGKTPDLSFFTFPRDEERCKQWIQKMRRAEFTVRDAKYCRLCSQHFADSQFVNASRKRLVWNAVPTIFDFADLPHEEKPNQYGFDFPPRKRRKIFAAKPITEIKSREIECPEPEIRMKQEPVVPDEEHSVSSFQHENVSDQEDIIPKQEYSPLLDLVPKAEKFSLLDVVPKLEYFSDQDDIPEQQDEVPQQDDIPKQDDAVMTQNFDLDEIKEEPLFVEDESCSNEELYEPAFVSVEERSMAATCCKAELSEDECELEQPLDLASESSEQEDPFTDAQDQFQVIPEIHPSIENSDDLLDDMPLLKRCPNAVAQSHSPGEDRTPASTGSQQWLKRVAKLMQEKEMSVHPDAPPPPERGSKEWAEHVRKKAEEHIRAVRQEKFLKESMEEGHSWSSKTKTSFRLATWNDKGSLACSQCQMVLQSFTSFQKHHCKYMDPTISRTVKVETPYVCLCREVFESYAKCAHHMSMCPGKQVASDDNKPFSCTFCSESFSSTEIQSAHLSTCFKNKPHQCYTCNRRFHDPEMRAIHVRRLHSEGIVCLDCGIHCNSDKGLKAHIRMRQCRFIVIYPCEYCGRMFYDIESQRNHLLIHSGDKTNNCTEESVQTKPSNEAMPTSEKQKTGLVHRADKTDNLLEESDPPKPSKDPSSTSEELKQVLVHRCDQQEDLVQENTTTLRVHPEPISYPSPTIDKQNTVLIHSADKRDDRVEESIQTDPTKNPLPTNRKPRKVFVRSGDKPDNRSEDSIQPEPTQVPYKKLKKLLGDISNKKDKLSQESDIKLDIHLEPSKSSSPANTKTSHKCDSCGKEFVSERQKVKHVRQCSKKKQFVCCYCGKIFSDVLSRMAHVASEHKHSETKSTCSQSVLRCLKPDTLKQYRESQTCLLPTSVMLRLSDKHICPICRMEFVSKNCLDKHSAKHTSDPDKVVDSEKATKSVIVVRRGKDKKSGSSYYLCSTCKVIFVKHQQLWQHTYNSHFKYLCFDPSCGLVFAKMEKCLNHFNTTHSGHANGGTLKMISINTSKFSKTSVCSNKGNSGDPSSLICVTSGERKGEMLLPEACDKNKDLLPKVSSSNGGKESGSLTLELSKKNTLMVSRSVLELDEDQPLGSPSPVQVSVCSVKRLNIDLASDFLSPVRSSMDSIPRLSNSLLSSPQIPRQSSTNSALKLGNTPLSSSQLLKLSSAHSLSSLGTARSPQQSLTDSLSSLGDSQSSQESSTNGVSRLGNSQPSSPNRLKPSSTHSASGSGNTLPSSSQVLEQSLKPSVQILHNARPFSLQLPEKSLTLTVSGLGNAKPSSSQLLEQSSMHSKRIFQMFHNTQPTTSQPPMIGMLKDELSNSQPTKKINDNNDSP